MRKTRKEGEKNEQTNQQSQKKRGACSLLHFSRWPSDTAQSSTSTTGALQERRLGDGLEAGGGVKLIVAESHVSVVAVLKGAGVASTCSQM